MNETRPRSPRWRFRAAPLLIVLSVSGQPVAAQEARSTTDVWLGGRNPLAPPPGHPEAPPSDFFDMFEPTAPWARTAAGIKVMELPPALILKADRAILAKIFADLARRHIALAVAFGWLHGTPAKPCGMGVEGYAHPGSAGRMARIVKAAGGDLAYVAMDEPLHFGHHYSGHDNCRYSIEQTAQIVAEGVAQVRAVFPNVKIGDTEPVGSQDASWPEQIKEWIAAYAAATHAPLAFLHADIQWSEPWEEQLQPVRAAVHQAHILFGIIYDGVGHNDQQWTEGAEMRFRRIEANPQWKPDQAIFESWELYPTETLPETQAGTLTNLALRYLQRY